MNSAKDIHEQLKQSVVGQTDAQQKLAVLMSLHLTWAENPDSRHPAPNAIVLGPTGSGKTHSLRQVSTILGLPFVSVDGTAFVPSGIKGLQTEEVMGRLWAAASALVPPELPGDEFFDKALRLANRGIIFIDEFDKLATNGRDGSDLAHLRADVQRRLLKLIEGSLVPVAAENQLGLRRAPAYLDTTGVLFILGGAFTGIDHPDIRKGRTAVMRQWTKNDASAVLPIDIISYGFLPELVARAPLILQFRAHTIETLKEILRNGIVSPLEVWRRHFRVWGAEITFSEDFINEAAERAMALGLGARGLQQVIFPTLLSTAYGLTEWQSQSPTAIHFTKEIFSN